MKKIEKQIEEDVLSSLPDNDLAFEKIEGKIDFERFEKPKKRKWLKLALIIVPTAAVSLAAFFLVALPLIMAFQSYGGGDPIDLPSEGTYTLEEISGEELPLSFENGQKAEIASSTNQEKGILRLTQSSWNYDGYLSFLDGPLHEIDLDQNARSNNYLPFIFEYSGTRYSGRIEFHSPLNESSSFKLTIAEAELGNEDPASWTLTYRA